jgi:hypothetical protein
MRETAAPFGARLPRIDQRFKKTPAEAGARHLGGSYALLLQAGG